MLQVGSFYAVLADTEDGYVIVKCKTVAADSFDAYLLHKGRFQNFLFCVMPGMFVLDSPLFV